MLAAGVGYSGAFDPQYNKMQCFFFLFLKHPMMAMERRKVNEKLLSGMALKCNQSWFDYFSVLIYTVLRLHNFCPKKAGI